MSGAPTLSCGSCGCPDEPQVLILIFMNNNREAAPLAGIWCFWGVEGSNCDVRVLQHFEKTLG